MQWLPWHRTTSYRPRSYHQSQIRLRHRGIKLRCNTRTSVSQRLRACINRSGESDLLTPAGPRICAQNGPPCPCSVSATRRSCAGSRELGRVRFRTGSVGPVDEDESRTSLDFEGSGVRNAARTAPRHGGPFSYAARASAGRSDWASREAPHSPQPGREPRALPPSRPRRSSIVACCCSTTRVSCSSSIAPCA